MVRGAGEPEFTESLRLVRSLSVIPRDFNSYVILTLLKETGASVWVEVDMVSGVTEEMIRKKRRSVQLTVIDK